MSKYKAGQKCEIVLSQEMADQLNKIHELGFTPQNCKLSAFVFESDKYELLTKLLGNRTIADKNVSKKKELLEKNGFKSSNPVIVNVNGQIIDGQHRRLAAEELGIKYKFTIDTTIEPEESLQTTIELNNSGKPWSTTDYIIAYAQNGFSEYEKLIALVDELQVTYSKMFILYNGSPLRKEQRDLICEGAFVFDEKKAEKARLRKQELDTLYDVVDNQRYKKIIESERFYTSYLELTRKENFNFSILKDQFDKMRYTVLDRKKMLESLIEAYNLQRRTKKVSY